MTSYVAIPNGDIDQDSPITQPLMTALRDNPIAIAEGETGAPRIVGAAMFAPSAGTVVQRNCLPSGTRSVSSGSSTTVTQLIEAASATALVSCTIQVFVTGSASGTGSNREVDIYKNGTIVQTYGTVTGSTVSISLAAGDNIGVAITAAGSGGEIGTYTLSALQYRVDTRSAVLT
jgi:hypothetical protein